MKKAIPILATLALLAVAHAASAANLRLVAHNQRSSSGSLSTLKWATCAPTGATNPCISTTNAWVLANVTGSTAAWQWDAGTGVLSMTGLFQTTSHISSNANGSSVISDKVTDMVINTATQTTTAASYECVEGTFLSTVGAHGCANVSTGDDFAYSSTVTYNVGGDANCIQRTLGGDDVSTGNPRSLANTTGGGGCDAGDGAFNLWTIVQDDTATGGQLVISNGIDLALAGTNYLTFQAAPDAVDDEADAIPEVAKPIAVLANDIALTDPVTVTVTTDPTQGTAVVTGTSPGPKAGITITYTANAGATGTDSFVYTVLDGDGVTSDTATVTINILEGGANDDSAVTTRNVPISINVGGNDVNFTDPVTITLEPPGTSAGGTATPPASGAAATRAFSYTPDSTPGTATYVETFVYRITDANLLTATATVTVTVNNTVPVANDAPLAISTAGVSPTSASGSFNAAGAGNVLGNTPSTVVAGDGGKGTTTESGNTVTYTPGATFFSGSDTFSYTITDSDPGTAESDTATVTVTIANVSPALADGNITATSGSASSPLTLGTTLGNGSLAQHTVVVSTQATNGSCAVNGAKTAVTYTSTAGYTGADSCVLTITDENGAGESDTATFSITVNEAPSTGGGGGGLLPGGGGSLDGLALALLGGAAWLRRLRQRRG